MKVAMYSLIVAAFLCCIALTTGRSVLLLSDATFASDIAEHELVLVNFYSSYQCPECQALETEFEKAAPVLQLYDPPVLLAAIDCGVEGTKVCMKHNVFSYPTLQVFKRGIKAFDYEGPRDSDGMIKHIKTKVTPLSKELKSAEEVDQFLDDLEYSIIGFFERKDSVIFERYEMFASTLSTYYRFAHIFTEKKLPENKDTEDTETTEPESALDSKYPYKNMFLIFRSAWMQSKFESDRIEYEGRYIPHVMRDWVKDNIFGLVGYRTPVNSVHFKTPIIIIYYWIDGVKNAKLNSYWRNRVLKVAQKFSESRSIVSFAVSNSADFTKELGEFGLSAGSGEKPVVIGHDLNDRAYVMTSEFTIDELERFASDMLFGKLQPASPTGKRPVPVVRDKDLPVAINGVPVNSRTEL